MNSRMKTFYMQLAKECSKMSRARRLQVGAVIVKNNNIISFSWNGMPAGWDNNCENEEFLKSGELILVTKPEVLHAERNAIDKLAKYGGTGGENSTLFSTHAPCIECAKSIYGAGIKEVYYGEEYRSLDGLQFLKLSHINVIKLDH